MKVQHVPSSGEARPWSIHLMLRFYSAVSGLIKGRTSPLGFECIVVRLIAAGRKSRKWRCFQWVLIVWVSEGRKPIFVQHDLSPFGSDFFFFVIVVKWVWESFVVVSFVCLLLELLNVFMWDSLLVANIVRVISELFRVDYSWLSLFNRVILALLQQIHLKDTNG